MDDQTLTVLVRLILSLLAGGIIGLERTYHGRPAGFRTHALVCSSSTLLVLLSVYQWSLLPNVPLETIRVDPTRMAQGIMTGIGFLGAGVIVKARFAVREAHGAVSPAELDDAGRIAGGRASARHLRVRPELSPRGRRPRLSISNERPHTRRGDSSLPGRDPLQTRTGA